MSLNKITALSYCAYAILIGVLFFFLYHQVHLHFFKETTNYPYKVECPSQLIQKLIKDEVLEKEPKFYMCLQGVPFWLLNEKKDTIQQLEIEANDINTYTFRYSEIVDFNSPLKETGYEFAVGTIFLVFESNEYVIIDKYLLRDIQAQREREYQNTLKVFEQYKKKNPEFFD